MGWITGLFQWLFGYKDQSKLIAQVQAATVKLCGFLPYAETIAKLLAVNPAVTVGTEIAKKICAAVNTPRLVGGPVMVDGVEIRGEYVGKD